VTRRLEGKVAIVTGAGRGIGRAIAVRLASEGAAVVGSQRNAQEGEALAGEVAGEGLELSFVPGDVTDQRACERLVGTTVERHGRVDILCNNAGVGTLAPIADIPLRDAEWIFAVNFWGVLHGCQVFVPRFIAAGQPAHIVNTGSEHSLGVPFPGMGLYTASKHAVLGLSDVLRRELADHRIGVSILCPGVVRTDIWNAGRSRPERFGGPQQSPAQFARLFDTGMDPDDVGRLVAAGIQAGDFFILSHREVRAVAEARCRDVLAAFDAADRGK
jgi:NAD(P)-dependent dehydrogenase (short-subunit alcohol dehydrogenase family)